MTGLIFAAISGVLVTNYRSFTHRYARYIQAFYDRPRWRWMHPMTEAQDRVGIRIASGLGLVMGVGIIAVEIAAVASGHVG